MKKANIKELNSIDIIVDIIGWMTVLTIIFYFAGLLLYIANDVKDAFEKCFYNTIIFFTALATLVGPIVLIWTLYNWKKQEKWKIRIDLVTALVRDINRFNNLYARLAYSFLLQKAIIREEEKNEINSSISLISNL